MDILISKNHLLQASSRILGAISDRTFSYVGLKAENDKITFAISDQLLAIYSEHECDVAQAGQVFVQAKFFTDVVRELSPGMIRLRKEDSSLVIEAGEKQEFVIRMPIVEQNWKELSLDQQVDSVLLPTEKLKYLIQQVEFCVTHEASRNYATVAFLHRLPLNHLRLVGSDGYRLSYAEVEIIDLPAGFLEQGISLSKKALSELLRVSKEGFEQITFGLFRDLSTIQVEVPGYKLYIRLSAVKYPKYEGVLPRGELTSVDVERSTLQNVARRVLLAADRTRALQLFFSNSSLTLSSKTVGSSEGRECIELSKYDGGEQDLAVNGKFLSEAFAAISSTEVTLKFRGKDDPIVLVPREEPEGCHSMHVLVPIHESEQTV